MPSSRPCRRRISWQPRDHAVEVVGDVEDRGVAVGHLRSRGRADRPGSAPAATAAWTRSSSSTALFTHTLQCPSRPPLMRTVVALPSTVTRERRHQVEHDVVVVAGVERDAVGGTGLDHAAHHIERAVAVERRDLDRHDVLDRREAAPERHRQHDAADGRLQIEADQRNFARDRLAHARSARPRSRPAWRRAKAARRDSRGRARSAPRFTACAVRPASPAIIIGGVLAHSAAVRIASSSTGR